MPGWFKEEGKKEEKKAEPIMDYDELLAKFNNVVDRAQMLTDEAYSAIYPVVYDLLGDMKDPNSMGDVGQLRMTLKTAGLLRTTTGRLMWATLKNIEDLNSWHTRYAQQLEGFVDALSFICESACLQIEELYKQLDTMKVKIEQMRINVPLPAYEGKIKRYEERKISDGIQPYQEGVKPEIPTYQERYKPEQPMTPQELEFFKNSIRQRIGEFKDILTSGDLKRASLAKGRVFVLCGKSQQKKQIALELFNQSTQEQEYASDRDNVKNEKNQPIFSPTTPKTAPTNGIYSKNEGEDFNQSEEDSG